VANVRRGGHVGAVSSVMGAVVGRVVGSGQVKRLGWKLREVETVLGRSWKSIFHELRISGSAVLQPIATSAVFRHHSLTVLNMHAKTCSVKTLLSTREVCRHG
jgi:hypothetical protein